MKTYTLEIENPAYPDRYMYEFRCTEPDCEIMDSVAQLRFKDGEGCLCTIVVPVSTYIIKIREECEREG